MLKEVIDDALARGERLKRDIVGQILKSAALTELLNNRRFTQTVAKIIQTKDEVYRTIHKNVLDALKAMSIPSKQQITAYEKRVEQLEKKLDMMNRRVMQGGLKKAKPSRSKQSAA